MKYLPIERRDPVDLVEIKNVILRSKDSVVLSPEQQFRDVVRRFPENVEVIAVVMLCPGLRKSEVLGLKWKDFD